MQARRSLLFIILASAALSTPALRAQSAGARAVPTRSEHGPGAIETGALKDWLTYIASDELQGRLVYSEGLGLAAAYIADHLKEWGVKPLGDSGSYFQTVKIVGVKTTSRSAVTVEVNGRTRTFTDGEGVTFPRNMGAKQTITGDQILFAGYGLQVPAAQIDDYARLDPRGKIVVWLGTSGPKSVGSESRRLIAGRSRLAIEKGAAAVIAPPSGRFSGGGTRRGGQTPPGGERDASQPEADFTTAQRYDRPVAPIVTAQDEFFDFLFSGSDVTYAELKELASRQEPLPQVMLKGVKLTINIDADYGVVNTRLTRNVVGVVEGTDAAMKDTFVAFGAHYDHTGYVQAGSAAGRGGTGGCAGQTPPTPREGDIINNGADDDGSGTVALMAIARAFALGARPKRSLLFVWHTGEESGLLGSRYNADYPIIPNEKVSAVLNLDMVGRNRCDRDSEANTVYLVGSDRISTELHQVSEAANGSLEKPMTLDYELNDPADPESLYTRSDHYSYAARGIPVIFYTTGLHRDYHYVTDEVDKIEWAKMARIAQLVYVTGQRVANLDHIPVRDNKGPRAGRKDEGGRKKQEERK